MTYRKQDFTFRKFIAEPGPIEGFEDERGWHGGTCIPWDLILKRDLSMGVFASGGAFVGTEVRPDLIPYLRAKTICGRLGATILTGLKMPNAFPTLKSDFTPEWLLENQAVTSVDVGGIGQMVFAPLRNSASIVYSTQLNDQAAGDFEDQIRTQITQKLFQQHDLAALNGSGGAQPLGLFSTNGTTPITWGGAPSWSTLMSFPQAVENSNADIEGASLGFACSPDSKYKWRTTPRGAGLSTYLAEGNRVAGIYPIESSTALSAASASDRCIFGNWSDLYLGIFGKGVFCTVDPYSKSATGERVLTCHIYADAGTPRPQSFAVSADGAAQ